MEAYANKGCKREIQRFADNLDKFICGLKIFNNVLGAEHKILSAIIDQQKVAELN